MITTESECRDFARRLEDRRRMDGCDYGRRRREAIEEVATLVRGGEINPENVSIRTLYEAVVPEGAEHMRRIEINRRSGIRSSVLMEAGGDAITTGDFSDILGQIQFGSFIEQMESPAFISNEMFTERPAETQFQEIRPGVSMLGDKAQDVGENEEYIRVGLSNNWVVTPPKSKRGFQVEVTEELVFENKGGEIMQQVNAGTQWLAVDRERERLDCALGIDTTFRYKNLAAQATYADAHTGFTLDNLIASNPLVDWTDLDVVEQAFDATVDPMTGEPVMITGQMDLVFPKALKGTVHRMLNATELRQGAISATVPQGHYSNPLSSPYYNDYKPLTSQYVKERTNSDSTWFVGMFKKAFEDSVIWPPQALVEDRGSGVAWERDLITRIKFRRKSAPACVAPHYVKKITG